MRGGKREGAGRPSIGVRKVRLTLDDATIKKGTAIGNGNLSGGVRMAVRYEAKRRKLQKFMNRTHATFAKHLHRFNCRMRKKGDTPEVIQLIDEAVASSLEDLMPLGIEYDKLISCDRCRLLVSEKRKSPMIMKIITPNVTVGQNSGARPTS